MKWRAALMEIIADKDANDRPTQTYRKKRDLLYEELGILAEEKYLSQQAKTNVVLRIKVRWDPLITEKKSAVCINDVNYNITRIFTNRTLREMELSLAYVD